MMRHGGRPAFRTALALALTLTFVAAACGDDSAARPTPRAAPPPRRGLGHDRAATSAAAETTTTVELTGPPIKLMVMFEGTGAVATPEVRGAKAAPTRSTRRAASTARRSCSRTATEERPERSTACGNQGCPTAWWRSWPGQANAGQYFPILEKAQIPVVGNVPAAPTSRRPRRSRCTAASSRVGRPRLEPRDPRRLEGGEPRPHRPRRCCGHRDLRQPGARASGAQGDQRRQRPGRRP